MKVRRATFADAAGLMRLYEELSGSRDDLGNAADLQSVLSHPGTDIWCAEAKGELIGMLTIHLLPNVTRHGRPYALIENVVTRSDVRGHGVGRAVMETAMTVTWTAGAYKIMLLTNQGRNARGFYEALGFSGDEKWGMILRKDPETDASG